MKIAVVSVALAAAPSPPAFAFLDPRAAAPAGLLRRRPPACYRRSRPGAKPLFLAAAEKEQEAGPRLYNTATREKQLVRPQSGRRLKFYSCGPTVYDSAHIGNFRAFLTYDVLKRWLIYRGYDVDHICNLTDVDDKIIQRMQRDGVGLQELTDKYANRFFEDLAALNIIPAAAYPRATEHIDDIVAMVQGLLDNGLAYERGGSVYFRVKAFPRYGSLANLRADGDGLQEGAAEGGGITDASDFEGDKESARDFALWKAHKPSDGNVFWDTPLGRGRPGWHIECSAMARRFLGDTLDLHAGGIDLIFPHHENEVAQSEGLTGQPFCSCWIHNAFVNVGGEKMSKSLGNFVTLRGSLASASDVRAFRYLVVTSQYRTPLNFTPEALAAAAAAIRRLDRLREALTAAAGRSTAASQAAAVPPVAGKDAAAAAGMAAAVAAAAATAAAAAATATGASAGAAEVRKAAAAGLRQFEEGMDDDLNTARAAAGLFAVVKAGEKALKAPGGIAPADAEMILRVLYGMDAILGLFYAPLGYLPDNSSATVDAAGQTHDAGPNGSATIPAEVMKLLEERAAAKLARDWAAADAARDAIIALGYRVKDAKGGQVEVTRA